MGGQQKVVKTLQAVIGLSGYEGCEKQLNAFGTEHPGGRITAFEGCCPTKPKNAPPGLPSGRNDHS